MKYVILPVLLLLTINLFCQNISGEWLGEISIANGNSKNKISMTIFFVIQYDTSTKKISGANTTVSPGNIISTCSINGAFNSETNKFILNEIETVFSNRKPWNKKDSVAPSVLNRFTMEYNSNPIEQLSGICECKNPKHHPLCLEDLKIVLRRYKPETKD